MSFNRAKEHLEKFNLADRIMEFPISSATVLDASIALNYKAGEIAKTLSFIVNNQPILVITAGDYKIDNSKFKHYFNAKATMINHDEVEKIIGHAVGGVCPFGINDGVDVYLDISLMDYEIVYPACGSSNSAVRLSIKELEQASNATGWIDVCKPRE